MKVPPLLAAVDIGSNSVLLLTGQVHQGRLHPQLQRKETVRLGGSLDSQGLLRPEAIERGLDCLRRYAELLAPDCLPQHRRAVATQTLREAGNRDIFLRQASAILGCEVEVISGQEEARLIYQGVSRLLPPSAERRLVVDIGGRSTELCLGSQEQLQLAQSHPIGSVSWAQRFFPDGRLDAACFEAAHAAARLILAPARELIQAERWDCAYGASGTAGAISKVLHQGGEPAGTISRAGLSALRDYLQQAGHIRHLPLQGLRDELRPVIGGGVSVMWAIFELLEIEQMRVTQGALRHGLLFSLAEAVQPGASAK